GGLQDDLPGVGDGAIDRPADGSCAAGDLDDAAVDGENATLDFNRPAVEKLHFQGGRPVPSGFEEVALVEEIGARTPAEEAVDPVVDGGAGGVGEAAAGGEADIATPPRHDTLVEQRPAVQGAVSVDPQGGAGADGGGAGPGEGAAGPGELLGDRYVAGPQAGASAHPQPRHRQGGAVEVGRVAPSPQVAYDQRAS